MKSDIKPETYCLNQTQLVCLWVAFLSPRVSTPKEDSLPVRPPSTDLRYPTSETWIQTEFTERILRTSQRTMERSLHGYARKGRKALVI